MKKEKVASKFREEGGRHWLSSQILEHAQLSPDLGRQMLPLDRTCWDGWAELADKEGGGGWDVVMKCCMRVKLGDVWTGRIWSVSCPCKSARTAHQQVLPVLAQRLNSHQNPQSLEELSMHGRKIKEKYSLCIEQTQLRGVWRMSDHCSLVTKV